MNEKLTQLYNAITMPQETVSAIEKAMAEKTAAPRRSLRRGVTVCTACLLALTITGCVRPVIENVIATLKFPEAGFTVNYMEDESGEISKVVVYATESAPFAQYREGRLYVIRDGETDITDQITEDQPWLHTYVDDQGYVHYMAVGYAGTLDNYGIYEFIREQGPETQKSWEGWVTGAGRNFLDPETRTVYPWVEIVWQTWQIPWSLPQ